ncbi:MAG: TetR/AcrR family transcriptional regulator [Pseudomonadota bacterium]
MDDERKSARRGYHHGNLREALIEATRSLIAEKGIAGVTIADAARAAGVSPAAPYRHFQNREELIAETAEAGFIRFADRLATAWNDGQPSPLSAFEALGRAYLAFAAEEPEFFAAMFHPSLVAAGGPKGPAGHRAFDVLRRACAELLATMPASNRPPEQVPEQMMALHIWALSHGVASLFAGPGRQRSPISPEDLLESGVGVYLRGLGLLRD